ncbi:MAG: cysteine desulfurase family protein [Candidatus Puniceispirillaceae bacterium]
MARQPQLYLDNNATAPLRPEAADAMRDAMGPPANPSSVHGYGRAARMLVETARADIAMLAGCRPADLVFTSGGTEANNLALSMFDKVITSAVEHDSVLRAVPDADVIGVDSEGRVDLQALRDMLAALDDDARPRTLVSVMMANNETGVIQPVDQIVRIAQEAGVAVHSDMVQMLGKQHLDFSGSGLDFASLSAHKIGGPAGVGALMVRPGRAMTSLLRGGGQEQGRRSGTENVIGIAGFGGAAKAAFDDIAHYRRMAAWRDAMEEGLLGKRGDVTLFGAGAARIGNTCCLAIGERSSETMVMALDLAGVAVSAGAACSSGKVQESHVLKAMDAGANASRAIRISGGWNSRESDFERLAEVLVAL